jgi:hypothetical protein
MNLLEIRSELAKKLRPLGGQAGVVDDEYIVFVCRRCAGTADFLPEAIVAWVAVVI